VGGNLCNASPAADTIPALIAHRAVCLVAGLADWRREVPAESFCVAPGRTVLWAGELLIWLRLPPPAPRSGAAYLRFIPRGEMDIAVAGAGVSVALDEAGRCAAARIALAAVAPTPLLVQEAGEALVGTELTDGDLDRAAERARAAARPISDMRGDVDHRRHLVGVLVRRALRIALARARGE
jgi:carbon-monoxide dehydrogenase medium subunit